MIAAGSSDQQVCIWDASTKRLRYRLPGHLGSVNDVCFSPKEHEIICSASSDRTLFLGELS
jgi:Prp8 binding protein